MLYDVTIVGAGIVGLATAYQLQNLSPSLKICVIDKESSVAAHQTGHNSGVIHSGIYYKPGSLKAKNCLKGYDMMIKFAEENHIPFDICAKIIVATNKAELPLLENIFNRGIENGLTGLKKLSVEASKEIEPHVSCIASVLVPQTGIINYTDVSKKMAEKIAQHGGDIKLKHELLNHKSFSDKIVLQTSGGDIETKTVVNCAGLYSDKIAKQFDSSIDVQIIPFRGEYYKIIDERTSLVKNLIYPVPNPNFPFLGVHFTRMIKGGIEAGPNAVLAYQREGYSRKNIKMNEFLETLSFSGFRKVAGKYWREGAEELYRSYSKKAFVKALQKLIPEIKSEDVYEYNAGVRAQACDSGGNLLDDFFIAQKERVVNVCNAPSPAATASLSVGETIATLVLKSYFK